MCCAPACAQNRCAWSTCTLAFGLLLLAGAAWLTKLYVRPAVVYHDIVCRTLSSTVEGLVLGVPMVSSTTFTLNIEMECTNPNPYTVHLISRGRSPVFLGNFTKQVGTALELPPNSVLPAGLKGASPVFSTHASVEIDTDTGVDLLPQLANSGGIAMYIQLNQTLQLEQPMVLTTLRFEQRFQKRCGIMIAGIGMQMFQEAGNMACADVGSNLTVPLLQANGFAARGDGLRFAADQIAPETIRDGTNLEQGALGIAMGILYVLALALLLWSCFLYCSYGRSEYDDNSDESDEENDRSETD
eukprot:TRINITY_DN45115_c0_g1_i1.p1 TRINITY_DN45115_c0_g1~~TRINITY_DN45115_c0_g1_i1.p1  ORF type:complete len:300 (+),score=31.18 TRINITY_DN45115_c0_g1_i1:69-968(+)